MYGTKREQTRLHYSHGSLTCSVRVTSLGRQLPGPNTPPVTYTCFFLYNFVFNPENNPFCHNIFKWYRYLDDVFCLFHGKAEELVDFVSFLNGVYPDLKFSLEYDRQRVSFLDMWIEQQNRGLITTLFKKKTDRNTFLLASSAHPKALKNGLPKKKSVL